MCDIIGKPSLFKGPQTFEREEEEEEALHKHKVLFLSASAEQTVLLINL